MKSVAIISTLIFSASISSGTAGSDIELHFPKMGAENGKKDMYREQWAERWTVYMANGKK